MPLAPTGWKVVCRKPGLRVDEQVAHVLDRIRPQTARIAALMKQFNGAADDEEPGLEARLEVVRYFNDDEQHDGAGQPRGRYGHALLGWALDREAIAFLAATGAFLDVDEYDMTASPPSDRMPTKELEGCAHPRPDALTPDALLMPSWDAKPLRPRRGIRHGRRGRQEPVKEGQTVARPRRSACFRTSSAYRRPLVLTVRRWVA
ncbi:DUF4279 domain-containing protein [Streptomyces sp. NPDC026589]|uniref:DUF4279 domain-containing protein n=1 Tax=Streptomyces sp. NPDC026589 TaxID=3155609 RepID=UPI003405B4CC